MSTIYNNSLLKDGNLVGFKNLKKEIKQNGVYIKQPDKMLINTSFACNTFHIINVLKNKQTEIKIREFKKTKRRERKKNNDNNNNDNNNNNNNNVALKDIIGVEDGKHNKYDCVATIHVGQLFDFGPCILYPLKNGCSIQTASMNAKLQVRKKTFVWIASSRANQIKIELNDTIIICCGFVTKIEKDDFIPIYHPSKKKK